MRSEFKQMALDFYKMYEQNDFFLQDIIYFARQAASMAHPYLDRATKNIEAIGRALIGEGSAFYQALSSTYTTLSDGAIAAYQQVTIFVTSTATEAARHYNQLAGEVVGRLIQLESVLSQRLEQLKNLYLEYSGRLETVIMEQVENVRQQAIELAESYIESFQPYLRYFESIVERARFFFDKIALSFNGNTRFKNNYLNQQLFMSFKKQIGKIWSTSTSCLTVPSSGPMHFTLNTQPGLKNSTSKTISTRLSSISISKSHSLLPTLYV